MMARNIGDLGVRREPVDLEFRYFGAVIRVHPAASDTVELEFLDLGRNVDLDVMEDKTIEELDDDERFAVVASVGRAIQSGYLLVRDSLRRVIHPDDWPTYWDLARANGQRIADLMADLKRITAAVVEADTGFPTLPPSASAGGPASTQPKYAGVSSSVAARGSSDADKALRMLRNRPDLQEFIVLQEEAEAARAQKRNAGTAAERMLAVAG